MPILAGDPTGQALASIQDPSVGQRLRLLGARISDGIDGGKREDDIQEQPFKLAQLAQAIRLGQLNMQLGQQAIDLNKDPAQPTQATAQSDNGSGSIPTNVGVPQGQGPMTPSPGTPAPQTPQAPAPNGPTQAVQPDPLDGTAAGATQDANDYANAQQGSIYQPSGPQQGANPQQAAARATLAQLPPQLVQAAAQAQQGGQGAPQAPAGPTPQQQMASAALPTNGAALTRIGRQRKLYATMALLGNKGAVDAWNMVKPDLDVDREGNVVDKVTGQLVNQVPHQAVTNGIRYNQNDPNAPTYFPTELPPGVAYKDPSNPSAGVIQIPGFIPAIADRAGATAGAEASARLPAQVSMADYTNAHTPIAVNGPDGPVTTTAAGLPALMSSAGGAIHGMTPGAQAANVEGATGLVKTAAELSNTRQASVQSAVNGQELRNLAQSFKLDNTTQSKATFAKILNSFPPDALKAMGVNPNDPRNYANATGLIEKLTTQGLYQQGRALMSGLGRVTQNEIMGMKPAVGTLHTPSDLLAYSGAVQSAAANATIERTDFLNQFVAQHPGATQAQAENAYQAGPGGVAIYARPEVKGLTFGGRPAVTYANHNGTVIGAFGAGILGKPLYFNAQTGRPMGSMAH